MFPQKLPGKDDELAAVAKANSPLLGEVAEIMVVFVQELASVNVTM